ncbi:lysophospholipid acyltransferase family protein [Brunnivagina elsteri]|uniref:1-acyl-sn-glycerol-3-phosphate acyltransferase n=1 Tax=Brunnivagina elsteri CCALA 953 TaxID=987040 RepID=A0A2A2TKW6_9CYAN|nr:1-acyl-sn-glycerol-3-phosphate acyltransferase [Calothrix elsteri]PAX57225.1 1-acyl-sn-glycerol-3-phosphate acyltransferase [Calothrix elsteri CCALA 953]
MFLSHLTQQSAAVVMIQFLPSSGRSLFQSTKTQSTKTQSTKTQSTKNQATKSAVHPQVAQVAYPTSQVSPWLSPLAYFLGRHLILPLFFGRIAIAGQENIPKTGPVIFAPTHRSRWDALLVPYAAGRCITGRDLRFMVTVTECNGLQGWFIKHLGGFPVNLKRPSITTLRHAVDLLVNGEMLVIFPEGGIRKGELHPLKPGISRLALTAEVNNSNLGVQILPISIDYSQTNPSRGTNVCINIGEPIQVADYISGCIKKDANSLMQDVGKSMQQLSDRSFTETNL